MNLCPTNNVLGVPIVPHACQHLLFSVLVMDDLTREGCVSVGVICISLISIERFCMCLGH